MSADLPPFSPISASTSPAWIELHLVQRLHAREGLGDAPHLQGRNGATVCGHALPLPDGPAVVRLPALLMGETKWRKLVGRP
jgi:hypothetical protein